MSWQTLLAGIGAAAGNRLSDRARIGAVIFGNLVIVAFAVFILLH